MNLYRRRYIPDERVLLDDEILSFSGDSVVTRWKAIRPRRDFFGGVSCCYIDRHVKVSKIYGHDGRFLRYYCDIISAEEVPDGIVFHDLLADVEVAPNGAVSVLDLGELADALDDGLITVEMAKTALRAVDWLLGEIRRGRFGNLTARVDDVPFFVGGNG